MTSVLLAYATQCGSTQRIAEHIASTLRLRGLHVEMQAVTVPLARSRHDAFVIGIAAHMASRLGDAEAFMRRNRIAVAAKPVWLFTSGSLPTDKEFAAFAAGYTLRSSRVFAEAMHKAGIYEDFRDWVQIEGWADSIAREVRMVPAARR
jgi:menaquinone-dependent protoporphyrinogen oxidase